MPIDTRMMTCTGELFRMTGWSVTAQYANDSSEAIPFGCGRAIEYMIPNSALWDILRGIPLKFAFLTKTESIHAHSVFLIYTFFFKLSLYSTIWSAPYIH